MAASEGPERASLQTSFERCRIAWVKENWHSYWYVALFGLLIVVAAGLHFWDLGSRAFNHDESLHATYSWYLYRGDGYHHDPMMHGPFQFEFNALIFKLSAFVAAAPILSNWVHGGATDYTARVLPAIFGTALVGLPYFLRNYIGRLGALLAALFFTISPFLLFFGRFARNDIYIGFFTLAIVICIWRYLSERRHSLPVSDCRPLASQFRHQRNHVHDQRSLADLPRPAAGLGDTEPSATADCSAG